MILNHIRALWLDHFRERRVLAGMAYRYETQWIETFLTRPL